MRDEKVRQTGVRQTGERQTGTCAGGEEDLNQVSHSDQVKEVEVGGVNTLS